MASNMDWSPDFCIICDTQMSEGGQGVYCSQACRLAELERSGSVGSPTSSNLSTSASSTSSAGGFHLPPAVNWSAYKTAPSPSRGFDMGHFHQQYHPANYAQRHASTIATSPTTARQLTPSSSRSSLSSTTSQSYGISTQTANQLSSYVRSFDQVREMRRRQY